MYLLDTNIVSELRRQRPHGGVLAWLESVADSDLHMAAITVGEIQSGIELTRQSAPDRAIEIEAWLDRLVAVMPVLSASGDTFRIWARLMHRRDPDVSEDALIAATAIQHSLVVVTRNVRDFVPFGVRVFNPFEFT